MKRLVLTMISCLLAILTLQAQAPEGISYQAVARDGSGATLDNQAIDVRFSVRQGSPTGTAVYVETHSTSTNDYGLFALSIGMGSASTGTFSNIDWGSNSYYLQVEVDDGSGFVDLGTTQMMSVPYALYAKEAGNAASYTGGTGINVSGNTITNTGDTDASDDITNSTSAGGDLGGTYPDPDVVAIQGRPVSVNAPTSGQVLKWNGSAWAPGNDNSGGGSYNAGTGIDITGNTISAENNQAIWNANELQGRSVSSANPGTGQVLKWNGSAWAPAADATGGGGSSVWSTSGSNAYYATGNVGVGTTTPTVPFHVEASGSEIARFESGSGSAWISLYQGNNRKGMFWGVGDDLKIRATQDALAFQTGNNNVDRLHITAAGNVGIGTSSPSEQLEVANGNILLDGENNFVSVDNSSTSLSSGYRFYNNGTFEGALFYQPNDNIINLTRNSNNAGVVVDNNGDIGLLTKTPSNPIDIVGSASAVGRFVNIEVDNINSSGDLLQLVVQSTATNNAQFIEFQRGSSTVAAINTDGTAEFENVEVEETTTTPSPNTVYGNALPMAYASISVSGFLGATINQDFGIASATRNAQGEITITLDNNWTGDPVVMVTCFNTSPGDEIATYETSGSNSITVNIADGNGNATDSNFSIVIFGTAQ